MAETKTKPTQVTVDAFIAGVEPPQRQEDARALDAFFRRVTGWQPVMWGPTMVGYGSYAYRYETGHGGTALATGFSPRKAELSLYIMPGYQDYGAILDRLGKHRLGKACLYIRRLEDIDIDVLAELVRAGLDDLGKLWPVSPS
jgi:Domain of unknown function (DU1801)